jgi:hypothetical protein
MALTVNSMPQSTYTKPEGSKAASQVTISIMAGSLAISMVKSASTHRANSIPAIFPSQYRLMAKTVRNTNQFLSLKMEN